MNGLLANPCQPSRERVDGLSRKRCADYMLKMQRRLDKAVRDNDQDRIRHKSGDNHELSNLRLFQDDGYRYVLRCYFLKRSMFDRLESRVP